MWPFTKDTRTKCERDGHEWVGENIFEIVVIGSDGFHIHFGEKLKHFQLKNCSKCGIPNPSYGKEEPYDTMRTYRKSW